MRVLLVQTAFLGDLVLSTGCIAKILDYHNIEQIDILTTSAGAQILKLDPRISKILVLDKKNKSKSFQIVKDLRDREYDVVYSLHKSYRTALILWFSRIKTRIGFDSSKLKFLYTKIVHRDTSLHEVERTQSIIPGSKVFPLKLYSDSDQKTSRILIFPGSVWFTKRWQGFSDLITALKAKGYEPLIIGSASEEGLCTEISKKTNAEYLKTTIQDAIALVSNAKLVVCNDSFPLHLASTFKVPNVSVFCATSPTFGFGPYANEKAVVVEAQGLPCKPCARHGGKACPMQTNACMNLEYLPVLNACLRLLNHA